MSLYSILGLAAAMFVLAITPGPGVFATVSKAIAWGFRKTIPVIAGIVAGDLIFLLLAIWGLAAIAEAFGALFLAIKYFGGAYLIWLGVKLWRANPSAIELRGTKAQSGKMSFLGGLSITLGNPKVILFYLGFLPTFVDLTRLRAIDIIIVACIVSTVLGSVMLSYAFAAAHARRLFKAKNSQKYMNQAAGSVMIGTGAVLLSKA
jgi:threonine/homoserine/homoserine lactone efflux protein